MSKRKLWVLTILAITSAILSSVLNDRLTAQEQKPPATIDAFAITNARVVTVSGPVIENGTVVVRDGLIVAVGSAIKTPADARVIDGKGMTIYPGLIDANTSLGIPAPAPSPARSPSAGAAVPQPNATPAIAPLPQVGLQPEIMAADLIRPGGDQIEGARNSGIAAALTVPREGIFLGQSALINLAGESAADMIVRSPVALHVGFTPLRNGNYPESLMGVFSVLRQMLLDAGRLRDSIQAYDRNPRGLQRPDRDKSLVALFPVLAGQLPVVMYADSDREIRRALDLGKEFNLRLVIAGGLESWKVVDRLREQDVPVLLSLNFPKRTTPVVPEADPEPIRILRQRVEATKTAGRLAAGGVRFAFQSGAMTSMSDYIGNAIKAIENGLSREEALRAMTIRPAEIFGVADRLGSIETGKIANLTITRGDLFDKSAGIAYVFIDGRPVDLKASATSKPATAAVASGTWTLKVTSDQGVDQTGTLILQQDGARLSGSIQGDLGSAQVSGGSIDDAGSFRFSLRVTVAGLTTEAVFTGKITGNQMQGSTQIVGRGPGSFTGSKP